MYIGFGYDIHRLVPRRGLILGGVKIEHSRGLFGHSDADVLIHAIMDALLGAAGLGDIGRHFPDTDEAYRGASSLELLARVESLIGSEGFRAVNIDATVVAQEPRLARYIEEMRRNIADRVGLEPQRVNVKATTNEGLGSLGAAEGIAAYAVVSLEKI